MKKEILKFKKKYTAKKEISSDRENKNQILAYNIRPFVLIPLPYKKYSDTIFRKTNGDFFLEIKTDKNGVLPYGQDRLVIYYLVTKRKQQGNRTVSFSTPREYFDLFKLDYKGQNYIRLMERIKRLFNCWYSWGWSSDKGETLNFFHFFDRAELWYDRKNPDSTSLPGFENRIKLSEQFDSEIKNHAIPVEIKVLAELKERPLALDLYSWGIYRAFQLKSKLELPLWGENGFIAQTNIDSKQRFKVRQTLGKTINQIEFYCSGLFDLKKDSIIIKPKKVVNKRC